MHSMAKRKKWHEIPILLKRGRDTMAKTSTSATKRTSNIPNPCCSFPLSLPFFLNPFLCHYLFLVSRRAFQKFIFFPAIVSSWLLPFIFACTLRLFPHLLFVFILRVYLVFLSLALYSILPLPFFPPYFLL